MKKLAAVWASAATGVKPLLDNTEIWPQGNKFQEDAQRNAASKKRSTLQLQGESFRFWLKNFRIYTKQVS